MYLSSGCWCACVYNGIILCACVCVYIYSSMIVHVYKEVYVCAYWGVCVCARAFVFVTFVYITEKKGPINYSIPISFNRHFLFIANKYLIDNCKKLCLLRQKWTINETLFFFSSQSPLHSIWFILQVQTQVTNYIPNNNNYYIKCPFIFWWEVQFIENCLLLQVILSNVPSPNDFEVCWWIFKNCALMKMGVVIFAFGEWGQVEVFL